MAIINNFGGGSVSTDELTATPMQVLNSYVFLGTGSDESQIGKLVITGNAIISNVLQGETFYNNNPKNKLTGVMTVNSLFSF